MSKFRTEQSTGDRAVGYARVSDESQVERFSLDAQEAEIKRWCERRGKRYTATYREEGVSAHDDNIGKRPELIRLLEDARRGHFDIAVVHTLDRWARNVPAQRHALQLLGDAGVGFSSVTEDIDFTTPSGRLVLTTIGASAEFFSDQLSIHVKKVQQQRAHQGLPVGPVPFGYRALQPGAVPQQVEGEALAVKESFHRRDEGESYGAIAKWLNSSGFRTRDGHAFTAHAVKDMLNNRYYCGFVRYKGEEFKGKHEAIVSEDVFQRLQDRKQRREHIRTVHGPKGLLQGMVGCSHCHKRLESDRHRQQVPLYRERHAHDCPTNNTSTVVEPIDKQVATIIHAIALPPDWRQRMAELATTNHEGPTPDELRERLRRLGRAYADGAYTDRQYEEKRAELDRQLRQASNVTSPAIEEAAELFSDIPMLWNEATQDERKQLVSTLIEVAYVDLATKRIKELKLTPAFAALMGTGMEVAPDALVELIPSEEGTGEMFGVGGGGGGPAFTQNTIYRYLCSPAAA